MDRLSVNVAPKLALARLKRGPVSEWFDRGTITTCLVFLALLLFVSGCASVLLKSAAEDGDVKAMEDLIAKGADVNVADVRGVTPLHAAAGSGQLDAARLLVAKGANVNAKDRRGMTPLHNAVGFGHVEVVKFLVAKGADVNAKDRDGWTPLRSALEYGQVEAADALYQGGATPLLRR